MAEFDIVIHGGRLIDGTGNPWFYGDVAIKAGKIAGIGRIDPGLGQRSISAKGRVVTPGYIDMGCPAATTQGTPCNTNADCPTGQVCMRFGLST